ncbi:zinc finger protein 84 isoform X3 [Eurytemora carolleeae]|uniref:zinc finger protein 84 isoform X3 n=1 Tax=Eurytemora carolleeae TaxID=1294199 RepID=UPI000C78A326|nr:zinc finger protein 84 isoform X3 [Eurytemora carolleeae]|eukprot:XP_023348325.1 zinc finger protein 84-like isoform X3 [Eurytemora affinis]
MDVHIQTHQSEVKCGECGDKFKDLNAHMMDSHSGFMSVLLLQTIRCAGDGSTQVTIEVVLATDARFLASEVKPFAPEVEVKSAKRGRKRKQEMSDQETELKAEIVEKKPASIKIKDEFFLKLKDEVIEKNDFSVKDEFALSDDFPLKEDDYHNIMIPELKFTPQVKKKKKKPFNGQVGTDQYPPDLSERDRALCPPVSLPKNFFKSGTRIWSKLPVRVHQCELCGFSAKTKNKYREKQDHLMKWHFSKRIERILPMTGKKPFMCPLCPYSGKDRQCVVRHYTGKHQALDVWMAEFLDAMISKSLTEDILDNVENVNINPKPGETQIPGRGKIVNNRADLKEFLSGSDYTPDPQRKHFCDECEQIFPSNSALKSHKLIDHNPSEKTRWEKEARIGVEEFRSLRLRNRQESDTIAEIASNSQETDFNSENSPNVETKSEKILKLEDEEGGGLKCLSCSNAKISAKLKSIAQLKDHIQNNHMDLCRLKYFVACETKNSSHAKSFFYTLCSNCGQCFSQNSNDSILEKHKDEHRSEEEEEEGDEEKEENESRIKDEVGDGDIKEDAEEEIDTENLEESLSPGLKQGQKERELKDEFIDSIDDSLVDRVESEPKLSAHRNIGNGKDSGSSDENIDELDEFLNDSDGSSKTEVKGYTRGVEGSRRCPCKNCCDPTYIPVNGVRVHTCILKHECTKTFTKIAHLKAHIRANNNERPYTCSWKGCHKSFVRRDELKRHAWIHTGETRFRCDCGRGYGRADHYRTHALKCSLSTVDITTLDELAGRTKTNDE